MQRNNPKAARKFKPNPNIKGGSKPGKPQNKWPLFSAVAGMALAVRYAGGTFEALLADRRFPPPKLLEQRMAKLFKGFWEYIKAAFDPRTKGPLPMLFKNRVYKQVYNGESARGAKHDPKTRGNVSCELWSNKTANPILEAMYEDIVHDRISTFPNWKTKLLPIKKQATSAGTSPGRCSRLPA